MPRQYVVDPQFTGDVFVGTDGDDTKVYLGQVAETGTPRKIYFGGSQEFVVMIIGKRVAARAIRSARSWRAWQRVNRIHQFPIFARVGPRFSWIQWKLLDDRPPRESRRPRKSRKQWASLDGWTASRKTWMLRYGSRPASKQQTTRTACKSFGSEFPISMRLISQTSSA